MRRRGAVPGVPGAGRAGRAAGGALRHQPLPGLDERAGRPGVPAARASATSRRWTSCSPTAAAAGGTTRRRSWRSVPGARLDRAVGPAAQAAADVLRPLRPRPARPPMDLRDRLAGRAEHAENARAVVGLGLDDDVAAAVLGGNALTGLRRPRGVRRARHERRTGLELAGDGAADAELETQGKQLHDTRNWMFLHGSAAQFETHTRRMLELEQEYLRRYPKRTWQGSGGAETRSPSPRRPGGRAAGGGRRGAGGRLHKLEVHQPARLVGLDRAALAALYTQEPKLLVTERSDRVITDAGRRPARLRAGAARRSDCRCQWIESAGARRCSRDRDLDPAAAAAARRPLPRLPRVLRAAGGELLDHHRAAHQRRLRLHLDADQRAARRAADPHRRRLRQVAADLPPRRVLRVQGQAQQDARRVLQPAAR